MLEGFEKVNLAIGMISVSISANGVSFSKSAVVRMGKCKYVTFYIDFKEKRIAIQKSSEGEEGAIKFYGGQKIVTVRWNNKELLKTISLMMGWQLDKGIVYKADGEYLAENQAIIFDLKKARKMKS